MLKAPMYMAMNNNPATNNTQINLNVTDPDARRVLAVRRTRTGGDVLSALDTFLRTPAGGWGETEQARGQLYHAVWYAGGPEMTAGEAESVAHVLEEAAHAAGWYVHPMRRRSAA